MPIEWTTERVLATGQDGVYAEREVRAARRWWLRVISDRQQHTAWRAPQTNFEAVLDKDLGLWVRPRGASGPYGEQADGEGAALEVVEDVTAGVRHQATVRVKPSDETCAWWACTCGVGSRGSSTPEIAQASADAHVMFATDTGRRPRDCAVAQREDGSWGQRDLSVFLRFRVCVRSDFSAVRAHRRGNGEEFELVVDGRLDLWTRRFGVDAALRRDWDARGVSLLVFDPV